VEDAAQRCVLPQLIGPRAATASTRPLPGAPDREIKTLAALPALVAA
jgi:hypothetical protein